MKKIEVDFDVERDGQIIYEGYADVNITEKNVTEVADFIRDNHFSGELCDIPSHVYDRIQEQVLSTAYTDMKRELKDHLLEDDSVKTQPVLPLDLINLLPEDVRNLIQKDKIEEYYAQFVDEEEEDEEEGSYIEYDPQTNYWKIIGEEEPTKENTLYMTIKQVYFDQIMSGEKKIEYREIKDTTYKKYLECDEEGDPISHDELLIEGYEPLRSDYCIWNDGIYPIMPKLSLRYLNLAVGYNKVRDTELVELDGFKFTPQEDPSTGKPIRFTADGNNINFNDDGDLCLWIVEFHIKRVVEENRAKK